MDMLTQILLHTPRWVFALLFVLIAVGIRQLLPWQAGIRRASIVPLALSALSLAGVASAFHSQPLALLAWAVAAALFAALVMARAVPRGTRYAPETGRFTLPGSALPLALMLGVFVTRYAVGVALALHPQWAQDAGAAVAVGTLYGTFSGLFLGRAARLWRLAMRTAQAGAAVPA